MTADIGSVKRLTKQLHGVGRRLEELADGLFDNNELYEDMFYSELVYAQRLVVELTRETIGTESPENETPLSEENEDGAFMPGELEDVLGEEEDPEHGKEGV